MLYIKQLVPENISVCILEIYMLTKVFLANWMFIYITMYPVVLYHVSLLLYVTLFTSAEPVMFIVTSFVS